MAETLRVAVAGASGLIGSHLVGRLAQDGHRVQRLVRDRGAGTGDDVFWDPAGRAIDAERLAGVDAVVNLAGEPLGERRWRPDVKRELRDSRVAGTRLLAETVASLDPRPEVLLAGSAIGYYGDRGDEVLTEDAPPGDTFLADMCTEWEAAADPARDAGVRVVHPRTGVVIAPEGPLIQKVEPFFRFGIGGVVGDGRQWHSWIDLVDEVRALVFLLTSDLSGPVNLVAPNPVQNRQLTELLGRVMRRPTILPIPVFGVRLLYGEMGVTLATESQRVEPRRLLDAGFEFETQDLETALEKALVSRR